MLFGAVTKIGRSPWRHNMHGGCATDDASKCINSSRWPRPVTSRLSASKLSTSCRHATSRPLIGEHEGGHTLSSLKIQRRGVHKESRRLFELDVDEFNSEHGVVSRPICKSDAGLLCTRRFRISSPSWCIRGIMYSSCLSDILSDEAIASRSLWDDFCLERFLLHVLLDSLLRHLSICD